MTTPAGHRREIAPVDQASGFRRGSHALRLVAGVVSFAIAGVVVLAGVIWITSKILWGNQ